MKNKNLPQNITTVLAEVAGAVVGQLEMSALLDQIIETTMKTLHAEVCSIFLEDKEEEPGILKCVAGSGFAKRIVGIAKYKIGDGFTGTVAKVGREFNIKSREELEHLVVDGKEVWKGRHDGKQWESGKSEFRNCIALPLKIKDQTLGIIKAENKDVNYGDLFTDDDLNIFKTIASVIALTIENARLHQKTEKQSKKLSSELAKVASAVVGQFEMPALLNQIIDTTMKTLHAEVCSIFLEDKENEPGVITCVAGSGFAEKIVGIAKYRSGEGLTGSVFKFGEGYNSKNRSQHNNLLIGGKKVWKGAYDKAQWKSKASEFRNGIGLPLKIKDQILGVIKAENKIPKYGNFFTEEDLNTFQTIANVIAMTIENARLHHKAELQSIKLSSVLSGVADAVVGQFEMTALLNQVIDTTMKMLHAEVCSIFLEDKEEEPGILKCVAGSGFAKRIVGIARYKIGEGFTGTVAKVGQPFNIKSREELEHLVVDGKEVWKGRHDDKQWESGKSEFRNCIALPLKIKEQTLGIIKAENKDINYGKFFTDEDLNIFQTIANVIAFTIENVRLHKQTETQLKTIASKAAHRIINQVANYDGIEVALTEEAKAKCPNNKKLLKLSERFTDATKNIKSMIQDFRQYGKPIKLEKKNNNLNKIIQDEIWLAKPPSPIQIHENLDRKIPDFMFDAGRFAESIKEMLKNAIRAISDKKKKGNISISTKLIEKQITKSIAKKYAKIIIEDDGPGIKKKFPVFDPFQSTDPQHTGLGLATVKENVEAHGGTITIIPHKKKGAHFEILLPIEGSEV